MLVKVNINDFFCQSVMLTVKIGHMMTVKISDDS
jgi:hypothetical protein